MVMTFRAAGWNLRIFFFRALEALMRHNLGTGGRGGLVPPGARGDCCKETRGQARAPCPASALPMARPRRLLWTPPSESLLLDSSPKRLAVWSLASSSSLVSAMVEWNREEHSAECSEGSDSLLEQASCRANVGLLWARVIPALLAGDLGRPKLGPGRLTERALVEISIVDCHLRCFLLAAELRGAASTGNRAWDDAG